MNDPYVYTKMFFQAFIWLMFSGWFWYLLFSIIFFYILWILELQDKIANLLNSVDNSQEQREAIMKQIAQLESKR